MSARKFRPHRAPAQRIALTAIGLTSAWACGEAREVDLSAYERPPKATTDTVGAIDTSSWFRTAGDELPSDQGLPAETGDGLADEDPGAAGDSSQPVSPSASNRAIQNADRPAPDPDSPADDLPSQSAQAVDVDRLLRVADEAYAGLPSLRASFHQVIDVPLLERRREGQGTWYQKGRSRFKMDFDDPPEDEIVADGTYLWLFYPSTNPRQVIRSRLGAAGTGSGTADVLARILEEARTSYEGRYVGSETVDGVETHVVSLRPTTTSQYRLVRVWIAVEDHLVRKFEITEENETVRTVTLTSLEPGAPLSDSLFRFVPPDDADVFEG